MHEIKIKAKRFIIKVVDEQYEADAYLPLKDESNGSYMGISWLAVYDTHTQHGTACNLPYLILDNESQMTIEQFLGLAAKNTQDPPINPKGYQ